MSDAYQSVHSQKKAQEAGNFGYIKVKVELYYPGSENKGADQLFSYCTAGLCLWFCICKNKLCFLMKFIEASEHMRHQTTHQDLHIVSYII